MEGSSLARVIRGTGATSHGARQPLGLVLAGNGGSGDLFGQRFCGGREALRLVNIAFTDEPEEECRPGER
jgi:hypothetical protein